MSLQAISAILQRDASAIAGTNLNSMRKLGCGGKKYRSYNARYEDAIVRAMVDKDGGHGEKMEIERSEAKLSMFDAVKTGSIDAIGIFLPWEGIEAEMNHAHTKLFKLQEVLKAFVLATREGYEHAVKRPHDVTGILHAVTSPQRS